MRKSLVSNTSGIRCIGTALLALLVLSFNIAGVEARINVFASAPYPRPASATSETNTSSLPSRANAFRYLAYDMMEHALQTYFLFAFPYDSLVALEGKGVNDAGGVMATLIDSLDTLAITNRTETFHTAVKWIVSHVKNFDQDVMVSVFETTIRVLGGLLSAHMMLEEGVIPVDATHLYSGELLPLCVDLADRLLPAYNTSTGMPYGSINLRHGVPRGEVTESANAVAGTNLLEMMMLTRLTGDPKYLATAEKSVEKLFQSHDPGTKLLGSHIDISTGSWTILHSSVGTGQDSTLEYLFKYHVLSGQVKWWRYFETLRVAALRYLRSGGLYVMANMNIPTRGLNMHHDSLGSFYPGLLMGAGHRTEGTEPLWTAHSILRRYGVMPESSKRDTQLELRDPVYPLRPEHVESVYYYYKATHDPAYLAMAEEFALGLHLRCRTAGGFAPLRSSGFPHFANTSTYGVSTSTESFLISETLKYLFLIFEEAASNEAEGSAAVEAPSPLGNGKGVSPLQREWIFSTEAHLIPDSFIWWPPEHLKRPRVEERPSQHLNVERLKNVMDLMSAVEARETQQSELVRRNKFRKRFWLTEATHAEYYCQNLPQCSLHRLSDSLFRA